MKSTNVFITKSFWLPVIGGGVTWAATKAQPWIELAADDQTAITGGVMAIVIAVVRRLTSRPAHFVKGDLG